MGHSLFQLQSAQIHPAVVEPHTDVGFLVPFHPNLVLCGFRFGSLLLSVFWVFLWVRSQIQSMHHGVLHVCLGAFNPQASSSPSAASRPLWLRVLSPPLSPYLLLLSHMYLSYTILFFILTPLYCPAGPPCSQSLYFTGLKAFDCDLHKYVSVSGYASSGL